MELQQPKNLELLLHNNYLFHRFLIFHRGKSRLSQLFANEKPDHKKNMTIFDIKTHFYNSFRLEGKGNWALLSDFADSFRTELCWMFIFLGYCHFFLKETLKFSFFYLSHPISYKWISLINSWIKQRLLILIKLITISKNKIV